MSNTATTEEKNAAFVSLLSELSKWKNRALAFQQGYKDKSFEVTALEIQLMDCRAHGVDKVTARINDSLKTKMLGVCVERNELREENTALKAHIEDLKHDFAASEKHCQDHHAEVDY